MNTEAAKKIAIGAAQIGGVGVKFVLVCTGVIKHQPYDAALMSQSLKKGSDNIQRGISELSNGK